MITCNGTKDFVFFVSRLLVWVLGPPVQSLATVGFAAYEQTGGQIKTLFLGQKNDRLVERKSDHPHDDRFCR